MVDLATIFISVSLSLISSLIVIEYRLRRKKSVEESAEVEEWYADSRKLAAEVRRNWQRLFDEKRSPQFSELKSEMSLISSKISRHNSLGEQLGVDKEVINKLDILLEECQESSEKIIHTNSKEEFEQKRESVLNAVSDVEDYLEDKS